jgi:hypothetical protein
MGRIKDLIQSESIRNRQLEFNSYPLDKERVVVEGWFRDERFLVVYGVDGRRHPPGLAHLMCVRILLGDSPPTIMDAEAEMVHVPYDVCSKAEEGVKKIIGLRIVSGFGEKVLKRLGGAKGCTHLTHLIVAMAPAALHGYWAIRTQEPQPLPRALEEIEGIKYWINSCHVWRENGPLIQRLKGLLEKREG